jgi:diguanylate cyclase (GGDEF)-like protein
VLRIVHNGKAFGVATLSRGLACFPDHGRRCDHLLQVADAALYEAKNCGRNRVVVSNVKTLKVVESPLQRGEAGR